MRGKRAHFTYGNQPARPVIAVVLEVAWTGRESAQGPRWFKINHRNFSGRRLMRLLGHDRFRVTNACREEVLHARRHVKPDARWLRENLELLHKYEALKLVLVCGNVAKKTFQPDMIPSDVPVVFLPHPAARSWTKQELADTGEKLRLLQGA